MAAIHNETAGVVILGCGAQGRISADLCDAMGVRVRGYLDDTKPVGDKVNGFPILGGFNLAWTAALGGEVEFTVALGDPFMRCSLFRKIVESGARAATLVHPNCVVSGSASIGIGVVISPFCYIKANARVGDFCLLEAGCTVGVDNSLGEGVFLGPSCHLNAHCIVGAAAFLGTGTIVTPRHSIGAGAVVGAGSTVVRDIPPDKVAMGSPARVVREESLGGRYLSAVGFSDCALCPSKLDEPTPHTDGDSRYRITSSGSAFQLERP